MDAKRGLDPVLATSMILQQLDSTCRRRCLTTALLFLLIAGASRQSIGVAAEPASAPAQAVNIRLRVEPLAELALRSEFLRELPNPADLGVERIVACEDYWSFFYLCGVSSERQPALGYGVGQRLSVPQPRLVRRIFVLKPATLVIDDQVSCESSSRVG